MNTNKISVIGLGKLGMPLAACFAFKKFQVLGVDINKRVVDSVNEARSPIVEPGLDELIKKSSANLKATTNLREAVTKTDVSFIIVATPSDKNGNFSNSYVEAALKEMAIALRESGKDSHLFVISSTVMPSSTEKRLIPLIEKYSQRKLNHGFGVCYVPDFVALGSTIKDFLNPDLVVIGESSPEVGKVVESIYQRLCDNKPYIGRMSIISGEIAKVSLNAYITMKISFANNLGNLCEKIPGAEVDLITKTIGADRRISPSYFKSGLSFGGTCFPRDTKAFIAFSQRNDHDARLMKTVDQVNKLQDKHLFEVVEKNLVKNRKVGIIGLAFKPKTPVIVESPGMKLVHYLLKKKVSLVVYDPFALDAAREVFKDKIEYSSSLEDCVKKSKTLVFTLPGSDFTKIGLRKKTIIDCWRAFDPKMLDSSIRYIALGKHK